MAKHSEVTVTPELAKEWLKLNTRNRKVSPIRVKGYADQMKAGAWRITGQAIQFDTDGVLIDGQHRLEAVVMANVPVRMAVVRELEPEVREVIDTGWVRQAAHLLSMEGATHCNELSGALRMLLAYEGGRSLLARGSGGRNDITNAAIVEAFHRHPGMQDSVQAVRKLKAMIYTTSAGFCHYMFSQYSPEMADKFFRGLAVGGNLKDTSPILLLRNRLLADRLSTKHRMKAAEVAAITVKAWNAWGGGQSIKMLKYAHKEEFPTILSPTRWS